MSPRGPHRRPGSEFPRLEALLRGDGVPEETWITDDDVDKLNEFDEELDLDLGPLPRYRPTPEPPVRRPAAPPPVAEPAAEPVAEPIVPRAPRPPRVPIPDPAYDLPADDTLLTRARIELILLAVVVVGVLVRFAFVGHGADWRTLVAWRESDYTQIARNFFREGMNPFLPRVDWRGLTTGYAEMEFPFIPWAAAVLYKVFGYHEEILRWMSALFSAGALVLFVRLARRLLSPFGVAVAVFAFATNGLLIGVAGSIQPEPLLLLMTIVAATSIHRWVQTDDLRHLHLACFLTGVAILAKSPAAALGFVIVYYAIKKRGPLGALKDWHAYGCAALALVAPIAWYAWAHHLYTQTGLSLGVSNETHFLNGAVIANVLPKLFGNIAHEANNVFMWGGLAFIGAALIWRRRESEFAAVWYGSALLFYLLALDTSGDEWSFYYHMNSIAPACLLIGTGCAELCHRKGKGNAFAQTALVAGSLALFVIAVRGLRIHQQRSHRPTLETMYVACQEFAPHIPADAQVLVRGGERLDEHGHPVAFNASMAFTWLDRKGLNYAIEDYDLEALEQGRADGCRYWLAQPADLVDELVAEADKRFHRVAEHDGYVLYDLAAR